MVSKTNQSAFAHTTNKKFTCISVTSQNLKYLSLTRRWVQQFYFITYPQGIIFFCRLNVVYRKFSLYQSQSFILNLKFTNLNFNFSYQIFHCISDNICWYSQKHSPSSSGWYPLTQVVHTELCPSHTRQLGSSHSKTLHNNCCKQWSRSRLPIWCHYGRWAESGHLP